MTSRNQLAKDDKQFILPLGLTLENPQYLSDQLITYLGNKRSLLSGIDTVIVNIRKRLGGRKIVSCDAFAGSGVVARLLKQHSTQVIANDIENYAALISRAYLTNKSEVNWDQLGEIIESINQQVLQENRPTGFIRKIYSPKNDTDIKHGERVFYTNENASLLDAYAQIINGYEGKYRDLLLAPILSEASIHANTGGVFKGFYKDSVTGIGKFGGSGEDALSRIKSRIILQAPVLSNFESESQVFQLDAAELPRVVPELDVVYLDPPYNQHPYGSNYFMLNLLTDYQAPAELSQVSGIPKDWNRSKYNVRSESFEALEDLVARIPSKFVILSFSDDGFLEPKSIKKMFSKYGEVTVKDNNYAVYRAARNLENRKKRLTEHFFILERGD